MRQAVAAFASVELFAVFIGYYMAHERIDISVWIVAFLPVVAGICFSAAHKHFNNVFKLFSKEY